MNTMMALLSVLIMLIDVVIWMVVIQAILSWLVAFNIINVHNGVVRSILMTLDRLLDPLLKPIRRVMPDLGGIDLSPMVLVLALVLVQRLLPALLLDSGLL